MLLRNTPPRLLQFDFSAETMDPASVCSGGRTVIWGTLCLSKTLFCLAQSYFGNLFFLPKSCIPGFHNYRVSVKKVPAEKLEEDCIMCYGPLKYEHEVQVGSVYPSAANEGVLANTAGFSEGTHLQPEGQAPMPQEQMLKKTTHCAMTPCKHYFHESCFNHWVEIRHQCPICRHPLKFYTG